MADKEDNGCRTTDYKTEAVFPVQRPSGPVRKGPKPMQSIPLGDDFVVVERPRSPSPPVVVDQKGHEAEGSSSTSDDKKEKKPKKPAATVKFAEQNDVRVFKEDKGKSMSAKQGKDDDTIPKKNMVKQEPYT